MVKGQTPVSPEPEQGGCWDPAGTAGQTGWEAGCTDRLNWSKYMDMQI